MASADSIVWATLSVDHNRWMTDVNKSCRERQGNPPWWRYAELRLTDVASVRKGVRYDWICRMDDVRIPTDLIRIPRWDWSTTDKAEPSSSSIRSARAKQARPYFAPCRKYLNRRHVHDYTLNSGYPSKSLQPNARTGLHKIFIDAMGSTG